MARMNTLSLVVFKILKACPLVSYKELLKPIMNGSDALGHQSTSKE